MMDIDMMLDEVENEVGNDSSGIVSIRIEVEGKAGVLPLEVYPDNTLDQIRSVISDEFGVDVKGASFENCRTGKKTKELNLTVEELNFMNGDKLLVHTGNNDTNSIKVIVSDTGTGKKQEVFAHQDNTLIEVARKANTLEKLQSKLNSKAAIIFVNLKTGKGTSDPNETLEDFNIKNGYTLSVNLQGIVGAE